MHTNQLREILQTACRQAEEDCKDVIPYNEHSFPYAFNVAMSKRLKEAGLEDWLINVLLMDNRYIEWGESVMDDETYLVYCGD